MIVRTQDELPEPPCLVKKALTVEIVQIKTAFSLPTVVCIHRLMCLSAEKVTQRLQHTPTSPLPWHHARVVQFRVGVRRGTFGSLNLARWASAAVEADALATLEIFDLNTVAVLRLQAERDSTEFVNRATAIIHNFWLTQQNSLIPRTKF